MPTQLQFGIGDPWIAVDSDGYALLGSDGVAFLVYRYTPAANPPYQFLPNVQPLSFSRQEGTDPGEATFMYYFGGTVGPQSFAEALDLNYSIPGTVASGDRLVVLATRPDQVTEVVWDGFVLDFQVALGEDTEAVLMGSVGVARALWDFPVSGRRQRGADDPSNGLDRDIEVPGVFNPAGLPNCTPPDFDHGRVGIDPGADLTFASVGRRYPVFLDESVRPPGYPSVHWTLEKGVRYLIYLNNPDERFVANPYSPDLQVLLQSKVARDGRVLDPSDDATYELKPITLPQTPIDGRDWPNLVYDLVRDSGFGSVFRLESGPGFPPRPVNRLDIFAQQEGPIKDLWLQQEGSYLDPALTNFFRGGVGRDVTNVVDSWEIQGAMERYEADFVLRLGYPSQASDATDFATLESFNRSDPAFEATADRRNKFRLYILDECAEGYYRPGSVERFTDLPDLSPLFDPDGDGAFVVRRRPPVGELLTEDANGRPLRYSLMISKDYFGPAGLWDRTGTWQEVQGGYQLLHDRMGIWISCENPNEWNIGESTAAGAPYPAGMVRGVEAMAVKGADSFRLKLTCCVDGDRNCKGIAEPTERSASIRPVTRTIDLRDQLRRDVVSVFSRHNSSGSPKVARDDSDWAEAKAEDARSATEIGVLEGDAVIPYFTTYYRIGDRIRSIWGRGMSLRTDSGSKIDDRSPTLPVVVRVEHDCDRQTTTLTLSDAGTARKNYERRTRRRGDGQL